MVPNSPLQLHFQLLWWCLALGPFTEISILLPVLWEGGTFCPPGWSLPWHMTCFGQWKVSTEEIRHPSGEVLRSAFSFPWKVHVQTEPRWWAETPEWHNKQHLPSVNPKWTCSLREKSTSMQIHWDEDFFFLMQCNLVHSNTPFHRETVRPYRR